LTNWLTDARTLASPDIVIVLVGNKKDLEADRDVTFMEAARFAQENGGWVRDWPALIFAHTHLSPHNPRADVSRDECSDGRERGGGLSQVRADNPGKD
jgi:GTPase SAR1 family protein